MSEPASDVATDITVPTVRLDGVTKTFGAVTAVSDVSLTVAEGEFVSLIGPSGCGKSTVLRLIADLEEASAGSVRVRGKSAADARRAQDYGIAFQQAGLLDRLTVRENIELPLQLAKTGKADRRARSDQLLEMIGLREFADHRPAQLSGGMQQRVAIARALARKPGLLLMDEPFGALDEMTRERMQTELLAIVAETGAAVVFVTHSISEAVYLSDRVVVMTARPGRVGSVVGIDPILRTLDDTRQNPNFFAALTEVRAALRAGDGPR